MSKDEFFIGWAETPPTDRRFFLKAGIGLTLATAASASGLAAFQRPGGSGSWAMGEVREWTGIAIAAPYPMLRTRDIDGTTRTALLGCQGKCAVDAKINSFEGQAVNITGSLIQRGQHTMIAVIDGPDWIAAHEPTSTDIASLSFQELETLEYVTLSGEILDTKCWFGAMRPANGKVHKSCASLCIRSGLPPAFYVTTPEEQSALMIMTDRGEAHGEDILPFVADPIKLSGQLQRRGDLLFLDTSVSSFRRL